MSNSQIHQAEASHRPTKELLTGWILLIIGSKTTHGWALRAELIGRGLDIDSGSVYRTLRRLDEKGLLVSQWGVAVKGPQRRLYSITTEGLKALSKFTENAKTIRDLHDSFVKASETNAAT